MLALLVKPNLPRCGRWQEGLIKLVELAYTYQGKGKFRKRTLNEIIEIIKDKDSFFQKESVTPREV